MAEPSNVATKIESLTPEDLAKGLAVFRSRLKDAEISYLNSCVHCGLCDTSCHYHRAEPLLENLPAHKLDQVLSVFKSHFTASGKLLGGWSGARSFDKAAVRAWVDSIFGRCTLCGRCAINCTMGIQTPSILRAARGALSAMGLTPAGLRSTVDLAVRTGNNMGISREDWIDTVQWLEQELQGETGDPTASIPIDKKGSRIMLVVNPREPKFFPLMLLATAKVFWAAHEDWTLPSDGWDLTNYALFSGEPDHGGSLAARTLKAAKRLDAKLIVLGECGHGYAAHRWEGPEWLQAESQIEMVSILELYAGYLKEGRIQVNPTVHQETVTLHDPCNLVRNGGVFEPQREILRRSVQSFVEMTPNREQAFCCGGGGGMLAMSEFAERRIKAGSVKAGQIRATGAKVVVAPCHNCIDQLEELNKAYQLKVKVKNLSEILAEALVLPKPDSQSPQRGDK
jgi:Fe-S oxidoreductase